MLTPGVANLASEDATARSHDATSWHPAAVAIPCTFAITGCGSAARLIIIRLHRAKQCLHLRHVAHGADFLQVVTRAEAAPVRREHDHPHAAIRRDAVERRLQIRR